MAWMIKKRDGSRRRALPRFAGLVGVTSLAVFFACSSGSRGSPGGFGAGGGHPVKPGPVALHSSSIAVTADGSRVWVVNADSDSVSEIDAMGRKLVREIPLAPSPTVDDKGHFTPAVGPRALALSPGAGLLYVTGERSGKLYALDLASGAVKATVDVGSEPIGVLVARDESAVFVACSNDASVVRVDPATWKVTATAAITDGTSPLGVPIPAEPWALGWSADGATLFVTHLVAPHVSVLDPGSLKLEAMLSIPDVPPGDDKRLANGQARGLYDVVARPGSDEVWVTHMMLAVGTAQPDLDFESTAFPTLSVLKADGTFVTRMSTNAMAISSNNGAFGDIVSGPHALEFTADGKWALMLNSASEDILAVDANGRVEAQFLHPLYQGDAPGHMQEGIVLSPDGKHAYVDERNTGDVAVIAVDTSDPTTINLSVDGPAIPRLMKDPMPAAMRHGQLLFNTANSDQVPITQNRWIACATCHPEGRSDAVTWKFTEGPRDTPSNAGGVTDTGFLFRTADRSFVTDYWPTVDDEQGGKFGSTLADGGGAPPTDPLIIQDLKDIQTYVNFAIPVPIPPRTDPVLVAKGKMIFEDPQVGCTACHLGPPAYTDSAAGNASLDLSGTVLLHDVGTCVTSGFSDAAHNDVEGHPREPCHFDTPTLRGIASSPPYLHDGSAPTLRDVLVMTKGRMGNITGLSSTDLDALVEFLRSL
jgi:YVTN family beta-propeller protein